MPQIIKNFVWALFVLLFLTLGLPLAVQANTPPTTITNLNSSNVTSDSLMLSWSAPSDDATSGQAHYYKLRYSTTTITDNNWDLLPYVSNVPAPEAPGTFQSVTVSWLNPGATYYFAIKSMDIQGSFSAMSNMLQAMTTASGSGGSGAIITSYPPSTITNLTVINFSTSTVALAWHAPSDDGSSGMASSYEMRYASSYFTEATWSSGTTITGLPYPLAAGTYQTATARNLSSNITYYFAIKSYDSYGYVSNLSNVVSVTTLPSDSITITSTTTPTTTPAGSISGRVVDYNNQPISGAWVKVYNDSIMREVAVDADGYYYATSLPAMRYSVKAFAPSTRNDLTAPAIIEHNLGEGESAIRNFQFLPASTITASVSGIVMNSASKPQKDVLLKLHNQDYSYTQIQTTGVEGKYSFGNLASQKYLLEINLPTGLSNLVIPAPLEFYPAIGQTLTKDIWLAEATKTIAGRVLFSDGSSVTNARINVYKEGGPGWAEAQGDALGYYKLKVGGGSWSVMVGPSYTATSAATWSYGNQAAKVSFVLDQTIENKTVNFMIEKANATVKGRVLNPDSSLPDITKIKISLSGSGGNYREAALDSTGTFIFYVSSDNYKISIYSADTSIGAPDLNTISAVEGQVFDAGTIYLTKRQEHIKGRVVTNDGTGAANVTVEAFKSGSSDFTKTTTDASGYYELQVAIGDWDVNVVSMASSNYFYSEGIKRVIINTGASAVLNFYLTLSNASISGSVTDAAGHILTDVYGWAFVELVYQPLGSPALTNLERLDLGGPVSKGSFVFNVPSGSYWVKINLSSESAYTPMAAVLANVAAGQRANVVIKLAANNATLAGYLKDHNGLIVKGVSAKVFATGENKPYQEAKFDTITGKYVLNLAGGSWYLGYYIEPSTGYYAITPTREPITLTSSKVVWRDIILVKADSVISGQVTDAAGNPLSHVWVKASNQSSLDQVSSATSVNTAYFVNGAESDALGQFKLAVPSGVYYLHAFLPPEFGFINPEEQKVAVSLLNPGYANLIFRNRDGLISGMVYLGGSKIDAFIWAWSVRGGYAQTKADTLGKYQLNVARGDVWHVGAAKEINQEPYKSAEIIVDLKTVEKAIQDLALNKVVIRSSGVTATTMAIPAPRAVAVTMEASAPRAVAVAGGATVSIPANAIANSGKVTVSLNPDIELPSQGLAKVVGIGYNMQARDDKGQLVEKFNLNVTISLPYQDDYLTQAKVSVDNLKIAYWDETSGLWKELTNSVIDRQKRLVNATVNHFTRFAIVAPADIIPPLAPKNILVQLAGANMLKLTWEDPTSDFHHAKVYRSNDKGTIGTMVYNDIASSKQEDKGLTDGVAYYYTVRAVDPAGNESTNIGQVSTVAKADAPTSLVGQLSGISKLTKNLTIGSRGSEVKILQQVLIADGFLKAGLVTGYFGAQTKKAVILFQEKYAAEVLTPSGLKKGTGFVGFSTRKKINQLTQ